MVLEALGTDQNRLEGDLHGGEHHPPERHRNYGADRAVQNRLQVSKARYCPVLAEKSSPPQEQRVSTYNACG